MLPDLTLLDLGDASESSPVSRTARVQRSGDARVRGAVDAGAAAVTRSPGWGLDQRRAHRVDGYSVGRTDISWCSHHLHFCGAVRDQLGPLRVEAGATAWFSV
jgi:hypothetical protein